MADADFNERCQGMNQQDLLDSIDDDMNEAFQEMDNHGSRGA